MAMERTLVTAEEFERFLNLPENRDRQFELIEGVIVELNPSVAKPTVIAMRIGSFLNVFVIPRDLGFVTGADGGYRLSKDIFFAPDVGFISKARLPELPDGYIPLAPDLAVEVVSPNDKEPAVHRKAMRYLSLGTRLVWVVYPDTQVVDVYRPSGDGAHVHALGLDDTLDGADVLPGFTLPVRDVFPQ